VGADAAGLVELAGMLDLWPEGNVDAMAMVLKV
jgi:hypothetical protein